jgi:hypothetical protein
MKIIKHIKAEWFRYGFETLAVVVGILAAFALDNWQEDRKTSNQTKIFLQHISSNLSEDLEELHALLEHVDLTINRAAAPYCIF